MCLVKTILFFCGNQNVYLKFLNQNGRQFRLLLDGPINAVRVTSTYSTGLGKT